jgi:hypothetical protein
MNVNCRRSEFMDIYAISCDNRSPSALVVPSRSRQRWSGAPATGLPNPAIPSTKVLVLRSDLIKLTPFKHRASHCV